MRFYVKRWPVWGVWAVSVVQAALVVGQSTDGPPAATPTTTVQAPTGQADTFSAQHDDTRHARISDQGGPLAAAGQVWREYDLRPYLRQVQGMDNPQQPIVDWILRETGTDRWFGSVPGVLAVEAERLRIFQTPEVHQVIGEIVDRFVDPNLGSHSVSVRLVTVESANWRSLVLPALRPIRVQTPGVEAWLLSKEQAALLLAQLRPRVDFREHNSGQIQIAHGQSHVIERWQPRPYPQSVQITPGRAPGYQVQMGEISEGFSLQIIPLAASNGRMMDAVVKCGVDQIEKLTPVRIDLNAQGIARGSVEIEVPQVTSWRIQERFHWPSEDVLLVSRGLVAMPGIKPDSRLPFSTALAGGPARVEALLVLECRNEPARSSTGAETEARVGRRNYHGRY